MIHRLASRSPDVTPPEAPFTLDACYQYCEAVIRDRSDKFPASPLFVSPSLRPPVAAVLAFWRLAYALAVEPRFEGRRSLALDRWEQHLCACYLGEVPEHPLWIALADTIHRFELPMNEFRALLGGVRSDLDVRHHTFNELLGYVGMTARPAGHLYLFVHGQRDAELFRYADELATALALTRLWQDIVADLYRGRVYIPTEDLHHFQVTEDDLRACRASEAVRDLMRYQVRRTRSLYDRAWPVATAAPPELAKKLVLMWHTGVRILEKLEAARERILVGRLRLTRWDSALIRARAYASVPLAGVTRRGSAAFG